MLLVAACASSTDDEEPTTVAHGAIVDDEGRPVLPNWATDDELAIENEALPPSVGRGAGLPPAPGFRVPAEYEPVSAVVMTWAGHTNVLRGIAVAAAAAGADVWMVGGPSSIAGVPADRYVALPFGYDSVWSRDYGPVGINEANNTLGIIDTTYRHYAVRRNDDAMSCKLANALGAECHTTELILDGGNYMTDGRGNVFVTSRIYDWNRSLSRAEVDELLRSYLGAERIHVFDYAKTANGAPADGTGHIDMFAKLVGECKVIVAQTTNQPFKAVVDKAAAYFENLPCAPGKNYEVARVKGWTQGSTWYTYTNSLIVNKTVIIPFYNDAARNAEAVQAYRDAMPGYEVVGVNSEATIVLGGSIHCVTREIPALPANP
jgi:agmatine/peptidylarginine deiminase